MATQANMTKTRTEGLSQESRRRAIAPACDVYESANELLVIADLPGVAPEAVSIHLEQNMLTLDARSESASPAGTPLFAEAVARDYHRRFTVPGGIDAAKISAELKNGVLHLHLPKSDALKPRQISVHAA